MVERIITLCGLPRAGKGTTRQIIELLVPERKRVVVSTSDILKEELVKQGVANSSDRTAKEQVFAKLAKTEGEDWLIKRAAAAFRRSYLEIGILDMICMPWDIEWLRTLPEGTWVPLYIEAPFRMRLERARAAALRGLPDSKPDEANISEERFQELNFHPAVIHIPDFRNIHGTFVIRHDSTIENLGRQIVSVLRENRLLKNSEWVIGARALLRFYDDFNRKIAARALPN